MLKIMTNIRGKNPNLNKIPFDELPKELKDCFDCEGCLCEDLCNKYEEDEFGKKVKKNE